MTVRDDLRDLGRRALRMLMALVAIAVLVLLCLAGALVGGGR